MLHCSWFGRVSRNVDAVSTTSQLLSRIDKEVRGTWEGEHHRRRRFHGLFLLLTAVFWKVLSKCSSKQAEVKALNLLLGVWVKRETDARSQTFFVSFSYTHLYFTHSGQHCRWRRHHSADSSTHSAHGAVWWPFSPPSALRGQNVITGSKWGSIGGPSSCLWRWCPAAVALSFCLTKFVFWMFFFFQLQTFVVWLKVFRGLVTFRRCFFLFFILSHPSSDCCWNSANTITF